jgi:predicted dithiol-disulfide oxidoreductase (DUF899 family)
MDSKDSNGRTPLSWAAGNGHEVVVKLLVEKSVDVDSKAGYDRTPLLWAERNGHKAVVKLLVENGFDVGSKDSARMGHEAEVKPRALFLSSHFQTGVTIRVASRNEWLNARKALLIKEKEATRARDVLSAERRNLPIVEIDKAYTFFKSPSGKATLLDLFDNRHQLIIYHFMFDEAAEEGCSSCSFLIDGIGRLEHLRSRKTNFAVVSRARISKIEGFKKRMSWSFPWYSSLDSDFNYDFHVTQNETVAPVEYNFKDKERLEKEGRLSNSKGEQGGLSVFIRDETRVYHTYSTYARGFDHLMSTYSLLDLTPLGRQDTESKIGGFLYHDEYSNQG